MANVSAVFCGLVGIFPSKTNPQKRETLPFSVKKSIVNATIRGWATATSAEIVYENSFEQDISDARFVFPAIPSIGLYKFEATIEGGTSPVIAKLQSTPETPVTAASFADEVTADVYRIPIGKVQAGKQVIIKISLVQQLRRKPESGQLILDFACVLIPRQLPRWDLTSDANSVRDKLRLQSNYVAVSDVEYDFSLECNANLGVSGQIAKIWLDKLVGDLSAVKLVQSPDNTVAILTFTKERFRTSTSPAIAILPADINLPAVHVEPGADGEVSSAWFSKSIATAWYEPGTIASSVHPEDEDEFQAGGSHDYWLILDRSGSMFGSKIEESKRLLLLFVKSLPLGCKFNILGFGSTFEVLFQDGCVEYIEANVETALKYASTLRANLGGTSVMGPLNHIFGQKQAPSSCRFIIFMTDGQFAESVDSVKRLITPHAATSRLFTVGIGKDVNRSALEELARAGSGMSEFIEGVVDFQPKVIRLMRAMNNQSLAGFELDWAIDGGLVDKRIPVKLAPAYYYGNPMTQTVGITRTAVNEKPILGEVTFTSSNHPKQVVNFKIPFESKTPENELILHRLAAFQQLVEMLENPNRSVEAAKFSEATGILCNFTSFAIQSPVETRTIPSNGEGPVKQETLVSDATKQVGFEAKQFAKAEIRSGKADESSVQLAEEVVAPIGSFEAIAGLQQVNGAWTLSEGLVKVVNSEHLPDVAALRDRVVKSLVGRMVSPDFARDDDAIGTLVGLAILSLRFNERRDQWVIIERKAHAFLRARKIIGVNREIIDLLATRLESAVAPTDEEVQRYSERVSIFSQVDQHALAVSLENRHDQFQDIITHLINTVWIGSDLEKARAIFIWLSSKDLSKMQFDNARPGSPEAILMELKAGRETYAHVYEMLCARAGLNCVAISGYVKGIGYHPGMKFDGRDHQGAWNAVKIDGKWRLVNANWAARRVSSEGLQYQLDEFFFLTDPKQLIHTHFPRDPEWQLLENPITLEQFELLPPAKSLFFTLDMRFIGGSTHAIIPAAGGKVTLQIALNRSELTPLVDFDYSLVDAADSQMAVDKRLHSFVLHEISPSGVASFHVRLPKPGEYRFVVFAAISKTGEPFSMVKKDASQIYTDICEWKIVAEDDEAWPSYPPCSGAKWGAPHYDIARSRGFSAIDPAAAEVKANNNGQAEVRLEISAKQEMFFVAKLRSVNDFSEEVLARSVLQRRIGNRAIFTVSAPDKGEFGLEIFSNRVDRARSEDENQETCAVFPFCQFLITSQVASSTPVLPAFPPSYLGPQPAFSKVGLETISHSDPLLTVEDQANSLQVVFGLNEPGKSVRAVANLIRVGEAGFPDQDFSDFVLHQSPLSGDRLAFVCRFPKSGTYKLEIYALANDAVTKSNSIPCVYNYVVEVGEHHGFDQAVLPFPKQYSQWHDGCFLVTPLDAAVKGLKDAVVIQVSVGNNARRVLAVVGDTSKAFEVKSDGIWEISVPPDMMKPKNKLAVMANFASDPPGSFAVLLEYDIV